MKHELAQIEVYLEEGSFGLYASLEKGMSPDQIYSKLGSVLNHPPSFIKVTPMDGSECPCNPIKSNTSELDLLLKELEMRTRPRILCIKKLDIELRLHENLVRITLSICRLDLDSPKPIEVWVESDSTIMDLLLKIPVSDFP